jgi:hypothetical protein
MIAFPRSTLAQGLVAALQGKALLGDAHNGLFLAAPRRTGKSTFLQGICGRPCRPSAWWWCMWTCGPTPGATRAG